MIDDIKKNKDIKEDEERLKEQEKKNQNTCISSLTFLILYYFKKCFFTLALMSDLFIIWKLCFKFFWKLFQSNVHLFAIDLRPFLSVIKLFIFSLLIYFYM